MTAVRDFYQSFSFVFAFLVAVGLFEASAGPKITRGFLWLVLLSMIVTNAGKFVAVLNGRNGG